MPRPTDIGRRAYVRVGEVESCSLGGDGQIADQREAHAAACDDAAQLRNDGSVHLGEKHRRLMKRIDDAARRGRASRSECVQVATYTERGALA